MAVLFIRAILVYVLVFAVIRLTGKRQLSELQPFDFVITLLIADLASQPVSDTSTPMFFGVVPIVALFLIQKLFAFVSLKSERFRGVLCGRPLIIIEKGVVNEDMMRQASYTIHDLTEHLRTKDVFSVSDVEYAILETGGDLSVLLKGENQNPTYKDMNIVAPVSQPSNMIIVDGKRVDKSLESIGRDEVWLKRTLDAADCKREKDVLFAFFDSDGTTHIQQKSKVGGKVFFISDKKGKR